MGKKQRLQRKSNAQDSRAISDESGCVVLSSRPVDQGSQLAYDTQEYASSKHSDKQHLESYSTKSYQNQLKLKGSISMGTSTECHKTRRWAYRNVYGLSIAFVVFYSAFIGLQNLQSSINSAQGLGLVTLSLVYGMFILSGFITPGFLKLFGTKYSLLFGCICHLIYNLSNYYPSWYTLVPASILIGFAAGPIWAAANSHVAQVAVTAAQSLGKKQDYLISKFTGIFFFFFQFSQVPGNVASSLILFPYGNDNSDNLGAKSTGNHSNDTDDGDLCNVLDSQSFDVKFLYILVSVYVGFIISSIVLLLIFVDRLPTSNSFFSTEKKVELYLKKPLIELVMVLTNVKMLLVAPIVIYGGMELAFAFGSFTEFYISQCFGTYQVGFTLIVLGVCSAVMSIIYSRLLKFMPRLVIVLFGMALTTTMLLFMLFWERRPSYYAIFFIAAGWGVADAMWTTIPASLTGILFAHRSDVAYSAMRIYQAAGFTIGFAMAELLNFNSRLWVLLSAAVLATLCSMIIELITQSKEDLLPCIYRRRTPRSSTANKLESGSATNADQEHENVKPPDREQAGVHQNPIFLVYQGRRPSAMSDWSADSLDGAVSANYESNDVKEPQERSHDTSLVIVNGCWHHDQPTTIDTSASGETLPEIKLRWLSPIRESEDNETDSVTSPGVSIQQSDSYMVALGDDDKAQ